MADPGAVKAIFPNNHKDLALPDRETDNAIFQIVISLPDEHELGPIALR